MKSKMFSKVLQLMVLVLIITLAACVRADDRLNQPFTAITVEDARQTFPELAIEIYPVKLLPNKEGRVFIAPPSSFEEVMAKRELERRDYLIHEPAYLNGKELKVEYTGTHFEPTLDVYLGDKSIYTTRIGDLTPIESVRGFWTKGGSWILEFAYTKIVGDPLNSAIEIQGNMIVNGKSLNEKYGYQESFDFQWLDGKPFYFYRKDDKVGFVYDGQHVLLGYDKVPHYMCCSAGAFIPNHATQMLSFFGHHGDQVDYVEIGVYR